VAGTRCAFRVGQAMLPFSSQSDVYHKSPSIFVEVLRSQSYYFCGGFYSHFVRESRLQAQVDYNIRHSSHISSFWPLCFPKPQQCIPRIATPHEVTRHCAIQLISHVKLQQSPIVNKQETCYKFICGHMHTQST